MKSTDLNADNINKFYDADGKIRGEFRVTRSKHSIFLDEIEALEFISDVPFDAPIKLYNPYFPEDDSAVINMKRVLTLYNVIHSEDNKHHYFYKHIKIKYKSLLVEINYVDGESEILRLENFSLGKESLELLHPITNIKDYHTKDISSFKVIDKFTGITIREENIPFYFIEERLSVQSGTGFTQIIYKNARSSI